jgi:DNA-binding NtrC family response regulator
LQHRYAVWALQECGGYRNRAAEQLGIDPKTLAKWIDDPKEDEVAPGH